MDIPKSNQWQLKALTEALGELTLSVEDSLSIGRGQDNDVVLGSKQISRNHALLSVLNGKLYLKDLDSSNGTFVNDERIEANKSKHLSDNDKVSFAALSFAVIAPQVNSLSDDTIQSAPSAEHSDAHALSTTSDGQPADAVDGNINNTSDAPKETWEVEEEAPLESILPPEVPSSQSDTNPTADTIQQPVQPLQANVEPLETDDTEDNLSASESKPVVDASKPVVNTVVATSEQPANNAELTKELKEVPEDKPLDTQDNSNKQEKASDKMSHEAKTTPHSQPVPVEAKSTAETGQVTDVNTEANTGINTEAKPIKVEKASDIQPDPQNKPAENSQAKEHTMSTKDPHDKTTTTELQKEADPEVLKAKQAATSQLSGTANLGGNKDLGTQGNNALDQALNNPATNPSAEKKPSGSWFIWVFVALIILGIALWMYNKGGV